MKPNVLLQSYRAERDALLDQIELVLTQDGRVCAAWLWGSLGRGEGDELSDLLRVDRYLDMIEVKVRLDRKGGTSRSTG
jgi:hypothetical protein